MKRTREILDFTKGREGGACRSQTTRLSGGATVNRTTVIGKCRQCEKLGEILLYNRPPKDDKSVLQVVCIHRVEKVEIWGRKYFIALETCQYLEPTTEGAT